MPGAFSAASSNAGTPNLADSPSLASVKTAIVSTPTGGVTGLGQTAGTKHQRVTTGLIGVGSAAAVTVTWAVPFTDANYTCVGTVVDGTVVGSAGLILERMISYDQNGATFRIRNSGGVGITGQLNAIAFHD